MICPTCGTNCQGTFCPQCGTKLSPANTYANNQGSYAPQTRYNPPPAQQAPGYTPNPYRAAYTPAYGGAERSPLKRSAASPLFLIATIVFSVLTLLFIYYIVTIVGYEDDAIFLLLLLVPPILITAGLWVTFGTSHSADPNRMGTAGFTLILVGKIISLVFFSIVSCILLIGMFVSLGAVNRYGSSSATSSVIVVLLLMIAVMVLVILHYVKVFSSISSGKRAAVGTGVSKRLSTFLVVLNFIGSAVLFIFMILLIASDSILKELWRELDLNEIIGWGFMRDFATVPTIMIILKITTNVLFSIVLLKYRNQAAANAAPANPGYTTPAY